MYSAEEADGMMTITVVANGFSIWPYFVEVTPFENFPGGPGKATKLKSLDYINLCFIVNAEGNGTDFESDKLIAQFNPGDSQVNVSVLITVDQIFEQIEVFWINLTVPDEFSNVDGRLLIKPGHNDIAEGEIINSNSM